MAARRATSVQATASKSHMSVPTGMLLRLRTMAITSKARSWKILALDNQTASQAHTKEATLAALKPGDSVRTQAWALVWQER